MAQKAFKSSVYLRSSFINLQGESMVGDTASKSSLCPPFLSLKSVEKRITLKNRVGNKIKIKQRSSGPQIVLNRVVNEEILSCSEGNELESPSCPSDNII